MSEVKVLTQHYDQDGYDLLKGYRQHGGYSLLEKALKMDPQFIIDQVKASGLRGRGGAGFSTGMKWSFLPKNNEPRYLLCNADEGEPGTFKDRLMMEKAPHQLIESMIISSYAINSHKSYIYVRGEYSHCIRILERAIKEAYDEGFLGQNILGSGFHHDMDVYSGAGAYICGEETALISSLEGLKGQPKLKPPFPAVQGYLRKPTIVNNVETLASVSVILRDGVEAYRRYGTEKSPGTKLFSLSGNIKRPGNYEIPLGYPLKSLIEDLGQGMKPGRQLKAVIPGGSSSPVLTAEEALKTTLDYECVSQMGSMLGSGAVIVLDDDQCMVDCLANLTHFYHHESCGQCTPCREGTGWLDKITHRILSGQGRRNDLDLLVNVAENMKGRTICALSDAAAFPVLSFVAKFRSEFEYYIQHGRSLVKGKVLHHG
jgi:NADH-quinone oxidoreductase subunit F